MSKVCREEGGWGVNEIEIFDAYSDLYFDHKDTLIVDLPSDDKDGFYRIIHYFLHDGKAIYVVYKKRFFKLIKVQTILT